MELENIRNAEVVKEETVGGNKKRIGGALSFLFNHDEIGPDEDYRITAVEKRTTYKFEVPITVEVVVAEEVEPGRTKDGNQIPWKDPGIKFSAKLPFSENSISGIIEVDGNCDNLQELDHKVKDLIGSRLARSRFKCRED